MRHLAGLFIIFSSDTRPSLSLFCFGRTTQRHLNMLLSCAHTGRVVDSLNNPCQNIHCLYLTWFGAHGGAAHSSLPTAGEVDLTLGTVRLPGDESKAFVILHSCLLPLARAAVAMDGFIPCAAHSIKLLISSYCPVNLSKSILSILIRMSCVFTHCLLSSP